MERQFPLIVDLKRGSSEDGPGIRTTLFFKGCPLSCKWCQNPEAIDPQVEVGFYPRNCIHCFDCEKACPEGAILNETEIRIDRSKCTCCGKCVDVCPGKGLRQIGRYYGIEDLVTLLLRDRPFYEVSGGGITLSGGEPTLWPEYAGNLLRRLKREGIHTALQTCGYFEYAIFKEEMLPWLDLIMYDLKLINSEDHLRYTGKENKRILDNFCRLLNQRVEIVPRIPLIPGFTTPEKNLIGLSNFLTENDVKSCAILPYNPMGLSKWDRLGKTRSDLPTNLMEKYEEEICRQNFSRLKVINL